MNCLPAILISAIGWTLIYLLAGWRGVALAVGSIVLIMLALGAMREKSEVDRE